jgi:hypothetical protein
MFGGVVKAAGYRSRRHCAGGASGRSASSNGQCRQPVSSRFLVPRGAFAFAVLARAGTGLGGPETLTSPVLPHGAERGAEHDDGGDQDEPGQECEDDADRSVQLAVPRRCSMRG